MKINRIIVGIAVAAVAVQSLGGVAWFSRDINAILGKMPESKRPKVNVELWGHFSEHIWTPPYAKIDSLTGDVVIFGDALTVTSFAELNELGSYDIGASKDNFLEECGEYVMDEFGQPYTVYDDVVIEFYQTYEEINFATVRAAFDLLNAAFETWKRDATTPSPGVVASVEKIAELAKETYDAYGKAKDDIEKTVRDTKATAENMKAELAEVQQELTRISEEAVYTAQQQINSAVSDFNGFVTSLENAISKGEWDDTMFEDSFNELTKSEQDLVEAITALQQSSQDPEVQNAITVLGGQLTGIRSLKSSLRSAIDAKDIDAAHGVLSAAHGMSSLYNSRAAISKANNRIKTLKSKVGALDKLTKATLATVREQEGLGEHIEKLRAAFSASFIISMDNIHQVNAFLASTNSMLYLEKRKTASAIEDFTIEELTRWAVVTTQEPLFRNDEDRENYETIGKLGTFEGSTYNTILRLIGSTYFVTYMDLDWLGRFANTYDEGSFRKDAIRGFYEEVVQPPGGSIVTNWYANKITAPANWADGSSVIVVNGKYTAITPGTCFLLVSNRISNCRCQVGREVLHCAPVEVSAAGTYYAHVNWTDDTPTLTVDNASTHGEGFDFAVNVIDESEDGQLVSTYCIGAMPFIMVYQ